MPSLTYDGENTSWLIFNDTDDVLGGIDDQGRFYTFTLTAENLDNPGEFLTTTYKLNIKSPCFDANLVTFPTFVEMPEYALYYLYEAMPLGITIVS